MPRPGIQPAGAISCPRGDSVRGYTKGEGGPCMPNYRPGILALSQNETAAPVSERHGSRKRKCMLRLDLRHGPRPERHPPRPPHRVTHYRSYPLLDFFTPPSPTCLRPSFSRLPPVVSSPSPACRLTSIAVLCVARGLCVAMVGMESLTDEIDWLEWDPDVWL
jgi:hypothetical protein